MILNIPSRARSLYRLRLIQGSKEDPFLKVPNPAAILRGPRLKRCCQNILHQKKECNHLIIQYLHIFAYCLPHQCLNVAQHKVHVSFKGRALKELNKAIISDLKKQAAFLAQSTLGSIPYQIVIRTYVRLNADAVMKKISILIVDDAPDICTLLSHWLRSHHTACVHKGADALTALSLLHFDLVITDIHMPDMSGLDVIRRIKQSQPWVKVLAISGGTRYLSAAAGTSQASDIGADGVILKPFDEERLLLRVKACWDGADAQPNRLFREQRVLSA